ncbi:hypothetical protein AVEN_26324-1 [Araneus ventricosus]|uniref:Uncharacterized protein n=1 Tax=Araneus ventricosus TaxID=182803 RepID=A0A4Y2ANU9_ARAVE|nr:hypothetical protein AVEN_26324-1 [Araneus ventricosus]
MLNTHFIKASHESFTTGISETSVAHYKDDYEERNFLSAQCQQEEKGNSSLSSSGHPTPAPGLLIQVSRQNVLVVIVETDSLQFIGRQRGRCVHFPQALTRAVGRPLNIQIKTSRPLLNVVSSATNIHYLVTQ